jgi:hypothetical protein
MGRCGQRYLASERLQARLLFALAAVGVWSCAGQKEEGRAPTDDCVPYCEKRDEAGCNELGSVENCKFACGLLVTDPSDCGAASKALLDCRLAQPNICRGCNAEQQRANDACTMGSI